MNLIFVRIKLYILLSFLRLKGSVINFWKGLWFNRNKRQDPESYIDQVSEISALEEKEYISLFLGNYAASPIYMPRATLLKIMKALPESYVFPSPDLNKLLKDELEKHNKEKIDQQIISQIQKQLPQNYSLHTPFVFNNNPKNSSVSIPNNMINQELQEQIFKNLPSDYKFN